MPVTVVYKSNRTAIGNLHRVLVIDDKGGETVHSFGSLELAIKFSESVPTGYRTKYLGPNAQKE